MATRVFRDVKGVEWSVVEVRPTAGRPGMVRPQFERGWLLFVSDGERRRLAPPPHGWVDLSEDGLRQLLRTAELSTPARFPVRRLVE